MIDDEENLTLSFEKLDGALMLLCGRQSAECAEIPALAGLGVLFSRIEAKTAGF
jgi:hypothetical protein